MACLVTRFFHTTPDACSLRNSSDALSTVRPMSSAAECSQFGAERQFSGEVKNLRITWGELELLVLAVDVTPSLAAAGFVTVSCYSIDGEALTHLEMPGEDHLRSLPDKVALQVDAPSRCLRLVLADGRLVSDVENVPLRVLLEQLG
eukprot:TRINITY_DN20450_c0_g1_i3.p2 TRINITY_DN20450_c0_g1~~TRINITY_DN20450_c0_g1_i3.p2  ORF type:complete len:147 (-),score=18.06 TRINITY_DN20450_c0_g1_i3:103-543(-)